MSENENDDLMDTIHAAVDEQRGTPKEAPQEESVPPTPPSEPEPEGEPEPQEDSKEAKPEPSKQEEKPAEPEEKDHKLDISRPPRRLANRTKGVWQTLSPELREDIVAREAEFDNALKRYDGLGAFAVKAERNGTTLQAAIRDFDQMEQALRQDPIAGAMAVWNRMGYPVNQVIQEFLRRATGQPSQQQAPPQQVQGLTYEHLQQELTRRDIANQAKTFEADPRHQFLEPVIEGVPDEQQPPVRRTMIGLLKSGLANGYENAYNQACRLLELTKDGVSPEQARKTAAANQARAAGKATVGAPSQESSARRQAPDSGKDESVLDTVRAAVARQRG
jgi:hypothetical protein